MKRKSIIISLKGIKLSIKEKKLINNYKPWGIILFKRNISSFNQVKKLVLSIKTAANDKKFPILIDEEGGTVSRLSSFIDNKIFSQKYFGDLNLINSKISFQLYKIYVEALLSILKKIGININTAPVLDLLQKNTHKIIGNRSYSNNPKIVQKLGKFCVKLYKKKKIGSVIKHIPGHGRALVDSHKNTPIVSSSKSELKKDFFCFKDVNPHFAMTAHIIYKKLDQQNVATFSKKIIKKVIREEIKFKGLIISDDIAMKALKYDLLTNAKKTLASGCNLVLYCSGNYNESLKLLKEMPFMDKFTKQKTTEFYKFLS